MALAVLMVPIAVKVLLLLGLIPMFKVVICLEIFSAKLMNPNTLGIQLDTIELTLDFFRNFNKKCKVHKNSEIPNHTNSIHLAMSTHNTCMAFLFSLNLKLNTKIQVLTPTHPPTQTF